MVGTLLAVELVKRSIFQCFCRSCQAKVTENAPSIHPGLRPRPPKPVIFVAEVRATEQSKGGLKYELVLSEPSLDSQPKRPGSPPKGNLSAEEIETKLKAAEERRQNLECQKINQLSEKFSKLQEVNQKKHEYNNNFIQATKESLEQKMEAIRENREAHLKAIQVKLKEHERHAEEVRQNKQMTGKEGEEEPIVVTSSG